MNKSRLPAVALFLGLLALPPFSHSLDLYLRFSPGLQRIDPKEVNTAVAAWADELKHRADFYPNLKYESGDVSSLRLGVAFEAELLLSLSSRLALGLSGGYAYADIKEENTLLSITWDNILYNHARPTKISAYPIVLSGYIFFPIGAKFKFYMRGGAGTLQARYVAREALKKEEEAQFFYSTSETAKAGRTAFLGGLGFNYNLDPSFGFFFEATAMSARVDGFSGENGLGQTGTLYSYEEYISDLDFWQAKMGLQPEAPSGANFRNVREATVDFSGFSIKMGLLLKF
jgi:hypothetical protein